MASHARAETPVAVLAARERGLLRFITCGSVDDGKSTLIGRLLHDTGSVPEDQLATLVEESRRFGTQGRSLDLALLLDGLSAEREQGITIDVAFRTFGTAERKFVVIDAPGHEQYTRNMVTGASQADCGVLLIDVMHGVTDQTRRHARLLALLGVPSVVLAVNKMDRVGFARERFDAIVADYRTFAADAGLADALAIPMSALTGDNVVRLSGATDWYAGPTLLEHLEQLPVAADGSATDPFRMAVQLVLRPNADFRGLAGTIAQGTVRPADRLRVQPSGRETTVARIVTFDGDRERAGQGDAVVLELADAVDCARGDVLVAADQPLDEVSEFEAELVWMDAAPLEPDRDYLLKCGTRSEVARVSLFGPTASATAVTLNDIATVRVSLSHPLPIARYRDNSRLGGFILIDRHERSTVAAGLVADFRAKAKESRDMGAGEVVWVIDADADDLARRTDESHRAAREAGARVLVLDDATLAGLRADLTDPTDPEWLRRAGEAARLIARTGMTVIVPCRATPADLFGGRVEDGAVSNRAETWVI